MGWGTSRSADRCQGETQQGGRGKKRTIRAEARGVVNESIVVFLGEVWREGDEHKHVASVGLFISRGFCVECPAKPNIYFDTW